MRRRSLLALLGGAAAAGSIGAKAQQSRRVAHIGYLSPGPKGSEDSRVFFEALASLGYAEGQNLGVAFDEYGAHPEQLPALVVRAIRAASRSIPIVVIAINYDPVERGYATSLAHPGGNLTGVFFRSIELAGKQVELLRQMVPQASRLTILWGAEVEDEFAAASERATAQGLAIRSLELAAPPYDFDAVFRTAAAETTPLVLVLSTPAFAPYHNEIAAAALRHRLPAMFRFRSYAEAGGLMSYGVSNPAMSRLAARYVARVLSGVQPAELPIERADAFELVINLKTAKALGLTVPQSLAARADEVIE